MPDRIAVTDAIIIGIAATLSLLLDAAIAPPMIIPIVPNIRRRTPIAFLPERLGLGGGNSRVCCTGICVDARTTTLAPQFGQLTALSEIVRPHSVH
jgi:hypothetical protein